MPDDSIVLFSLGSNIGDKIGNINKAIKLLRESGIVRDIQISSYYETEPYGYLEQPWFINLVLRAKCKISPIKLLLLCKSIEHEVGRKARAKWHEREIDIDLILFGNEVVEDEQLTIPHPAMQDRLFVLLPAAEIAGELINPKLGLDIKTLLITCKDRSSVKLIETPA